MRFKALWSILVFSIVALTTQAQIFEPVKWKYSTKKIDAENIEFIAKATIEPTWHVYALKVSSDPNMIGPIPTSIKFDDSKAFQLVGGLKEGKYITHFDPNFEADLNYYENSATFTQKIKVLSKDPFKITGKLEYMSCNDERCVFPAPEEFEVVVKPDGSSDETVAGAVADPSAGVSNIQNPVHWTYKVEKISDTEYEVIANATVDAGYHIYSAVHLSDGPMPTELKLNLQDKAEVIGTISESPEAHKHFDENFGTDVYTYEGSAAFRLRFKVKDPSMKELTGEIKGMVCADVCRPFSENFKLDLAAGTGSAYDPLAGAQTSAFGEDPFVMPKVDLQNPLSNCEQQKTEETIWWAFVEGLFWGILALLMPCIFPMIPLTVSFFTKGAGKEDGKRKAIFYGFSIFMIYVAVSIPFHILTSVDPEMFNEFSTNTWVNAIFFAVFVVFAVSFFGYFEITLPSSFSNKMDEKSNIGGYLGIFFMALTLVTVSFSCTGPILGSMLGKIYSSNAQGVVNFLGLSLSLAPTKLTAATAGFGIALGAPFGLFAFFPSMMKKLPKSGGWMDDFKVSLGFLELALAVKFLSNADLVNQWGILKRETFFLIWVIIGLLWILYLLGVFRFKKGQGTQKMSAFKWGFVVVLALLTARMVPGVFPQNEYNKFRFLSGFPPPGSYSWYHYEEEFRIYEDLAEAMEVARKEGKPVFLDFTGWACVNCRKMEENVWPTEKIQPLLSNEFVMVSLYVDEKRELPADQQMIYKTRDGRNKKITTVGNKWATLQTETFENNSQPFYAILTPDGELLTPTTQYEPDKEKYEAWLRCGIESHKAWLSNK